MSRCTWIERLLVYLILPRAPARGGASRIILHRPVGDFTRQGIGRFITLEINAGTPMRLRSAAGAATGARAGGVALAPLQISVEAWVHGGKLRIARGPD